MKEKYKDAEYIDARGGVIMPAFINTHEHIYSAMARGLSIKGYHPKGFLDILDGQWWTIDRKLTPEQILSLIHICSRAHCRQARFQFFSFLP